MSLLQEIRSLLEASATRGQLVIAGSVQPVMNVWTDPRASVSFYLAPGNPANNALRLYQGLKSLIPREAYHEREPVYGSSGSLGYQEFIGIRENSWHITVPDVVLPDEQFEEVQDTQVRVMRYTTDITRTIYLVVFDTPDQAVEAYQEVLENCEARRTPLVSL